MNYLEFLIRLINVKTIVLISLTYILFKFVTHRYSQKSRWIKFATELPGPRIYPFVGCASTLLLASKIGFGRLFTNYLKIYGSTFRVKLGRYLAVVISDVNEVQTVLTSPNCVEKKDTTKSFSIMFGNSLPVAAPAAIWKRKRREYQPFFTKTNILLRIQEMNEMNDKYIEKMKKQVDGPEFDLEDYMNDLSFDTIMKSHLNYDVSDEERKQLNMHYRLNEAFSRVAIIYYFPFSVVKAMMQWLHHVDIGGTVRMVHNFVDKVVNSMQKSPTWSGEKETETKTLERDIFAQSYINKLFKMEKELNEPDLVHFELLTLILAGSETTGHSMAFCFLALAAHPEIQEKAYQEIYQVYGDDERPIELSDLNKFLYLEQVIKETLRLFTVLPIIARSVEKDTKIGTRNYPAGADIIVSIGSIHHNPAIYPHPYRFNPDNFTPEAIEKRPRYSFIPFSAGSRNCIGKEYAETNMKLRLIAFLRKFTFHTNVKLEDIKIKPGPIETSLTGYPVSIKLRRKEF